MKKNHLLLIGLLLIVGCGNNNVNSSTPNLSSNSTNSSTSTNIITSTDVEAPVLYNVKNQNYSLNDSISTQIIKKNVYAMDNVDGKIEKISLQINNYYTNEKMSTIDVSKAGKYKLIFSAKDSSGNKVQEESIMRIGQPDIYKNNDGSTKDVWGKGYEYSYEDIQNDYKLVFEDTFNGNGEIDKEKWEFHTGTGSNGWGNGEKQYYTDRLDNVSKMAGYLRITAKKESYKGMQYTSGRVRTIESFQYGKFEIKANIGSGGKGTWPAIWLLPQDPQGTYGTWPVSGEIDLMESSGNYYYSSVIQTLHRSRIAGSTGAASKTTYIPDFYSGFHTYTLEWLPNKITMAIDGVETISYSVENQSNPTYEVWPYDVDYYLIMNFAVGSWDTQGMGGTIDNSIFDNEDTSMYIDYVRIYQSDIVSNLYPTK